MIHFVPKNPMREYLVTDGADKAHTVNAHVVSANGGAVEFYRDVPLGEPEDGEVCILICIFSNPISVVWQEPDA